MRDMQSVAKYIDDLKKVYANQILRLGWGTWIRTKINGVRVRCSTIELSPNRKLFQ